MEIDTDRVTETPTRLKAKNVTKRNGKIEAYDLSKITIRLQKLCWDIDEKYVNIDLIVKKTEQGLFDGIKTTEIDNLTAETAAYMNIIHPQYSLLAARIVVNNLHKETKEDFADAISDLYHYVDKTGITPFYPKPF